MKMLPVLVYSRMQHRTQNIMEQLIGEHILYVKYGNMALWALFFGSVLLLATLTPSFHPLCSAVDSFHINFTLICPQLT